MLPTINNSDNPRITHPSEGSKAESTTETESDKIEKVKADVLKQSADRDPVKPSQSHKKPRFSASIKTTNKRKKTKKGTEETLQAIIDNPDFPWFFRDAAKSQLNALIEGDHSVKLPDELWQYIFAYLSDKSESLKLVSQRFHSLVNDSILHNIWSQNRLNNIETQMRDSGFSERWESHLQIVKHRLKTKEIEATPKAIYLELIKFQQERFPKPPFKCDANPYTAEGFLEREKLIKEWSYFLFAKQISTISFNSFKPF